MPDCAAGRRSADGNACCTAPRMHYRDLRHVTSFAGVLSASEPAAAYREFRRRDATMNHAQFEHADRRHRRARRSEGGDWKCSLKGLGPSDCRAPGHGGDRASHRGPGPETSCPQRRLLDLEGSRREATTSAAVGDLSPSAGGEPFNSATTRAGPGATRSSSQGASRTAPWAP